MQSIFEKVMNARKGETILIILTKVCVTNNGHQTNTIIFRCERGGTLKNVKQI